MHGKFNSINDKAIYELTLDGTGESVGSVDEIGHFTRYTVDESFTMELPFEGVTKVHAATYIVLETTSGFVDVRAYDTTDAEDTRLLEERWTIILEECAAFDTDETFPEL